MNKLSSGLSILVFLVLGACSKQWREVNLELNSGQVAKNLNDTIGAVAQGSDSTEISNFQRLQTRGTLFYSEFGGNSKTSFGANLISVFGIRDWSFILGEPVSAGQITSAKAYFVESIGDTFSEYAILFDVVADKRFVKAFSAQSISFEEGQIVLPMSGGFELRSFDLLSDDTFADTIQLNVTVQGFDNGKISTLKAL